MAKKIKPKRPKTPVFFENFAPPVKEKAKKNLASKKRYLSVPKEMQPPVNLLISILHSYEKIEKAQLKKKGTIKGNITKKKSSLSAVKRNVSLPINL